jgi:hypothetical protein
MAPEFEMALEFEMAPEVITGIEEFDDSVPVSERHGPPVPSGAVMLNARDRAPAEELEQISQR